jgi:hypothetical protein
MSSLRSSLCAAGLVVLASACFAQTPPPVAPLPGQAPTQAPPTEAPPAQPTQGDDKESIEAGKKWLELLDSGNAGAAWDLASKQLQSVVKRDAFVAEISTVRKPLGKIDTRTPVKFARSHELPGAPSGDYAIVEFDTKYANGKHLSEQVIWTIESGDIWRVAGYYYR